MLPKRATAHAQFQDLCAQSRSIVGSRDRGVSGASAHARLPSCSAQSWSIGGSSEHCLKGRQAHAQFHGCSTEFWSMGGSSEGAATRASAHAQLPFGSTAPRPPSISIPLTIVFEHQPEEMTDTSAQFRPAKGGNRFLGVQSLHFPALFPLAARAGIFLASAPKRTRSVSVLCIWRL